MSGETEGSPSGFTVDTALRLIQVQHDDLKQNIQRQIDSLKHALDERYETQTKAIDAAKESQETAMHTAFDAADKAVQAALESAKEAVIKAELASDKRFEAVNEFRSQLSDQASLFMPRAEAESNRHSLNSKLDDHILRADARIAEITTRLDLNTGEHDGSTARDTKVFAIIAAVGGVLGILLSIAALFAVFRI